MNPVTLKPVTQSRVADISDRLPVLLLERNQWPASYVKSLVKKSPACITSSKGTQLPLELWLDIIEIVEYAPDYCALLQPVSVRETNGPCLLVCVEITDWDTCGELKYTRAYEHHIYNPYQKDGYVKMKEGDEEPRPWRIPEVTPDNEILIDLGSVPEEEDHLVGIWCDVEVRHIIAFMKGGNCSTCGELRWLYIASRQGWEIQDTHRFGACWPDDGGSYFLCPLCCGEDAMDVCVDIMRMIDRERYESDDEEVKKLDKWCDERLEELKYRRHRFNYWLP
ncbi:hypothetical protein CCHR01_19720 [Colletotrichum chrysophilum]|uniref:Uncharacterized protein n=1 Tax=Colletotrichum chrysophilum TaxID=1836956 RepID=A0AAD9E6Z0_9PEZI|nr:hypothetical protein CCHR01_19720 [Colletotrichum chrysophilum]